MAPVRRLVVDVLKPHEPPLVEFTDRLSELDGVDGVTASLVELDQEVQNVHVAVEGEDVTYRTLESTVETLGGTVHSVDQVACGERVVSPHPTPRS